MASAPQDLSYGFSTWSGKRLTAHLKETTGGGFGVDSLRRLLHRHCYSVQRPKLTMKGRRDVAAYRQAQENSIAWKKRGAW